MPKKTLELQPSHADLKQSGESKYHGKYRGIARDSGGHDQGFTAPPESSATLLFKRWVKADALLDVNKLRKSDLWTATWLIDPSR